VALWVTAVALASSVERDTACGGDVTLLLLQLLLLQLLHGENSLESL